jgi:REP element-mobilizing transposase RayT
VWARGIERTQIFRDDKDRNSFISRLIRLVERKALLIYAWALVPNHFHLLVRTGKMPLSRSMQRLLTGHAGTFNRRYRRVGHLFQNRYRSTVCEDELYFLELVRYIHLNPIRAKLVKDLRELEMYPYSGHSAVVGKIPRPWQETDEVLTRFGERRSEAIKKYREFVAEGLHQGRRPDLMGGGLVRSMGGWQAVKELMRGREAFAFDERVLGSSEFAEKLLREADECSQRETKKVDVSTLGTRICSELGVSWEAVLGGSRVRKVAKARAVLAYVWVRHLGQKGSELAHTINVDPSTISVGIARIEDNPPSESDMDRWCRQEAQ